MPTEATRWICRQFLVLATSNDLTREHELLVSCRLSSSSNTSSSRRHKTSGGTELRSTRPSAKRSLPSKPITLDEEYPIDSPVPLHHQPNIYLALSSTDLISSNGPSRTPDSPSCIPLHGSAQHYLSRSSPSFGRPFHHQILIGNLSIDAMIVAIRGTSISI